MARLKKEGLEVYLTAALVRISWPLIRSQYQRSLTFWLKGLGNWERGGRTKVPVQKVSVICVPMALRFLPS